MLALEPASLLPCPVPPGRRHDFFRRRHPPAIGATIPRKAPRSLGKHHDSSGTSTRPGTVATPLRFYLSAIVVLQPSTMSILAPVSACTTPQVDGQSMIIVGAMGSS